MTRINTIIVVLILFLMTSSVYSQTSTPLPLRIDMGPNSQEKRSFNWFLPIKSEKDTKVFWNLPGARALTVAYMTADEDMFTSKIEVLSDALYIFRIGFGVTVASASREVDAKSDNADTPIDSLDFQTATVGRLLEDGGTINTSFVLPVFYLQRTNEKDELRSLASVMVKTTGGFDAPRAGDIVDKPRLSGSIGFEATALAISLKGRIGFEVGLKGTKYFFNNEFKKNLGFDKNSGNLYGLRIGVILLRQTRLGVSFPFGRSKLFDGMVSQRAYIQQNIEL